ncbi:hypothetical protein [Mycolicibacterium peregrinum]|uniref:hypothetical protein n=1 Tax=Mycolicibacterium peregrinum TaxID=43304 RepID=UPI003AAA2EAC
MPDTKQTEPSCPDCGHTVPICHTSGNEDWHWARHTQTGNLTSGDSPECDNSGKPWTGSTCPECGLPGDYGLNTTTWSFDRCPRCWWPGK